MEFKKRLVKLRKDLNLTQEEFATKIGFSRTAVSAWETGRNEPSNADTIKIADFFGVSTDYLLGKTDVKNTLEIKDDEIDIAFYEGYKDLEDEDKEVMRNTLKAFLRNKNKK